MKKQLTSKSISILAISVLLLTLVGCGDAVEKTSLATEEAEAVTEVAIAQEEPTYVFTVNGNEAGTEGGIEQPTESPSAEKPEAEEEEPEEEPEAEEPAAPAASTPAATTPEPATPAAETPAAETPAAEPQPQPITYGDFTFSCTDFYGNTVNYSDFSGAKVIMINLWEPWCGPCKSELGSLEQLYENYQGQGLVIIGGYSTVGYEDTISQLIATNGLTYPLVELDENLWNLETGSVPTTYFVDTYGNILSDAYIGSRSYSSWEAILNNYL